jgi:hypothetical protein
MCRYELYFDKDVCVEGGGDYDGEQLPVVCDQDAPEEVCATQLLQAYRIKTSVLLYPREQESIAIL